MTKAFVAVWLLRMNRWVTAFSFLLIFSTCDAQFKETPPAPYPEAVARGQISTLLQQVDQGNSEQTIRALSGLLTWYRDIIDEGLISAWESDRRPALPETIRSLADPRVASTIVEFSWRKQRGATFNLTYAPMLGDLMARYPESANPFLMDLLGSGALSLDLSPQEEEAVCRILLDMPDSGTWRARALQILPTYRNATDSLLNRDLLGGDTEKSTAARFWLADLRAARDGIKSPATPSPRVSTGNSSGVNVQRPTITTSPDVPDRPEPMQGSSSQAGGIAANPNRSSPTAGDRMPVVISKVEPDYTPVARKLHVEGTVTFSVLIARDGLIHDIRVIKSLGYGLDAKAIEAIRKWKFEPGVSAGIPADMQAQVVMKFGLLTVEESGNLCSSGPMTFTEGNGLSIPDVTDGTMPVPYPGMPRENITLAFLVDAGGSVSDVQTLSGSAGAAELLRGSLFGWTFRPALQAGRPVELKGTIQFVCQGGPAPPLSQTTSLDRQIAPPSQNQRSPVSDMSAGPQSPQHPRALEDSGLERTSSPPTSANAAAIRAAAAHSTYGEYKVSYKGGTLRDFRLGTAIRLSVGRNEIILEGKPATRVVVPSDAVTSLASSHDSRVVSVSVGIGVSRVISRFYIDLRWDRESIVLEVSANEWRGIIADLEGATGVRANAR